jgi:hypothetical protein
VTPTATARFYRLLDRLDAAGYLQTVDTTAKPKVLAREFAAIPEGTFVRMRNCRLRIPPYVEFGQLLRASGGRMSPFEALQAAGSGTEEAFMALEVARYQAGRTKTMVGTPTMAMNAGDERRLAAAAPKLARLVARNPRVPMSCGETANPSAGGLDMLFPIRLGELSPEGSLLSGPVTVVGKIVRAVRRPEDAYVDSASLAVFAEPVGAAGMWEGDSGEGGLAADVTVLPPGAVILPVAIYK